MALAALVLAGFPADGLLSLAQASQAPEVDGVWSPPIATSTVSDKVGAGVGHVPSATETELEAGFRVVIGDAVLRIYDDPKLVEPAAKPARTSRR